MPTKGAQEGMTAETQSSQSSDKGFFLPQGAKTQSSEIDEEIDISRLFFPKTLAPLRLGGENFRIRTRAFSTFVSLRALRGKNERAHLERRRKLSCGLGR